ncbi:MAG: RAMP superfamily CRISPR-associated protein, partial [Ktedonobacteraceae bacterium]
MKHFYLSLNTRSPLAVRASHAESGTKLAPYIPGTAVLGSLASAHRLLRSEAEEEFTTLFLQQRVLFPHLYPACFADKNMHEAHTPVMPLPKTAQTCKRFPGFHPWSKEDTDEERHGIRDSLLDWTAFALLNSSTQAFKTLLEPFEGHKKCQYCSQVMDHENGYYRCSRRNIRQRMKAETHTHLQTRTGINREWGTVEEGILYSREVFDQGTPFWGEILLPDELVPTFKGLVTEADDEKIIHMGTGRTRGMGQVTLKLRDAQSQEDPAAFQQRLLKFDQTLRISASKAPLSAGFYLAMTLHSASILCDSFLRYYTAIDGALFATLLRPYLPQDYPAITWQRIY